MHKILVVDDEEIVRFVLSEKLAQHNYYPIQAYDGWNAVDIFQNEEIDAVLLDLKMPGIDGIETLHELKKHKADIPVIIVTAFGDIPTAVQAIKLGAYDFIEKPPQISKLIVTLERAVEKLELERRIKNLGTAVDTSLEWLMGRSVAMKGVIEQIKQVAMSDFSIILQGETGTGKSFLANVIHNLSRRAGKEFVKVDISVIPETLIESELFGHEKGAFTGADRKKRGYFELAHGGTIFIDELENMSQYMQSKFLSVVEDRKVYPVGSIRPVGVDARLIAATNGDIKSSVAEKKFREDLFFRIGEFIIPLPPLRERTEDIPFLSRKFVIEAAAEMKRQMKEIDENAVDFLISHSWPGNIRELKNVIRRAVLLSEDGVIRKGHIKFMVKDRNAAGDNPMLFPLRDAIADVEKRAIKHALQLTKGNKTKSASLLRIDYKTLLYKIKEYGIKY